MNGQKKKFLITIDTEGDNAWAKPKVITTRNADYLFRFQELCEKYGMKPTYLTNYEMCESDVFRTLAKEGVKKNTAEVGMHLHAWHSPPEYKLTSDDYEYLPYLIEYPTETLVQKATYLTKLLEDTFETKMVSHRAGRWAFNATYARTLVELGYKVDCSVTPYVSWAGMMGDPNGKGGTDYRLFPDKPYWLDIEKINQRGTSSLLEIPVTILPLQRRDIYITSLKRVFGAGAAERLVNRFFPYPANTELRWFRPSLNNLPSMTWLLNTFAGNDFDYIEFMIHSSEFMPGGSPYFTTEANVDALFQDLEQLFTLANKHFEGATLSEYHTHFLNTR